VKWLLDTNVVCEPGKRQPNAKVIKWLDQLDDTECAVSVITLVEITKGIYSLTPGPRRREHDAALKALKIRFEGRILPVDERIVEKWGELMGEAAQAGRPLPAIDNLVAASAVVHGLTLVTRDVRDIAPGVRVFNPFGK
jgi:predicted nucleic acid-binding protein